jgi:hypothetical protein
VYHENGTITFVRDKGLSVYGIVRAVLAKDGHEIEVSVPYKGFLNDPDGKPIIGIGKTLDLSFSLETSAELTREKLWTSDTGEPIEGYVLTSDAETAAEKAAVAPSR